MSNYVRNIGQAYYPEKEESTLGSLFREYERVIVESLVTSFGLDFLIHDQHGGDVDTIHNVRQVGSDPLMSYKNTQNQKDYENRGTYESAAYHSDSRYYAQAIHDGSEDAIPAMIPDQLPEDIRLAYENSHKGQ